MKQEVKNKVGLGGLTGLIVGGTIGLGIFALPATLTAGANPGGVLIGWTIVAIGMFSLAGVYRNLTLQQPKTNDGIHGWLKNLFGDMGGFIANYGHGIGDTVGNASYLIVIFSALGGFSFLQIFGNGTTWPSIIGASILLWIVTGLVLKGIKTSTIMNNITTTAKVIPIAMFIISAILNSSSYTSLAHFALTNVFDMATDHWMHVSIFDQSKSVLLSTIWTSIGIESGTIFTTRARKLSDVTKATNLGAVFIIVLLVGTSVLSLGLLAPNQISKLHDPSVAGLMGSIVGPWGGWLIYICLIVSIVGALIAWVNLCNEQLRVTGRDDSGSKWLAELNEVEAPKNTLLVITGLTQVLMIIAGLYSAGCAVLLKFSTSMATVPYFFASLYVLKSIICGIGSKDLPTYKRITSAIYAVLATAFTLFMIFGVGLCYLLSGAIIWVTGFGFFYQGKKEKGQRLNKAEQLWWGAVAVMALVDILGFLIGTLQIE